MRRRISICLLAACLPMAAVAAQQIVPHATDSNHEWTFGKQKVQVTFHVRMVGSSDAAYPLDMEGYNDNQPVSIVRSLGISVNGHEVVVPSSAWGGLFDVNYADVQLLKNGEFLLSVIGADGIYTYQVRINFNKAYVLRKRVSDTPKGNVTEDTYYH